MKKNHRITEVFFLTVIFCFYGSCATAVRFRVTHPPLVDLRGVSTITVIPLEWQNKRYYSLAPDVTQALTSGVMKAKMYNFVNPSKLINVDKSDFHKYVDAYITGEINKVTVSTSREVKQETVKEKDQVKTIDKVYTTIVVSVNIEYKYIRSENHAVLGSFNKTEETSAVVDSTNRRRPETGISSHSEIITDFDDLIRKRNSHFNTARAAIGRFSNSMNRELVPWTSQERRRIFTENTNLKMAEAQKYVKKKKYFDALVIYNNLYMETGDIYAGFNTALLLQANGQFDDALLLLEKLEDKIILESGLHSPSFLKNEINSVRKIINDQILLKGYKLQ